MNTDASNPIDQVNGFLRDIKANWADIANLDEHLFLAMRLCEQLARGREPYAGGEDRLLAARRAAAMQELLAVPSPVLMDLLIALNEAICSVPVRQEVSR